MSSRYRGSKRTLAKAFPPETPQKGIERYRIIVGVDYGTTYTGVSWAESTATGLEGIRIIKTWPGPNREADEVWKTPSRIAFSDENKPAQSNSWGYLVKPSMTSCSWTKLLLDMNATITDHDDPDLAVMMTSEGSGMLRLPHDKTATVVVGDYLREIYKFAYAELEKRLSPEILKVTPLEFWFTVPAIWSDKAKDSTMKAAKAAGFGCREGDEIYMIPEPEAAAISVLKSLHESEGQIKAGDGILVCDCGGGTVDITTYEIKSTNPAMVFEELVVGTGGKCGSTYIDRQFHEWMTKKFGLAFENLKFDKKSPGSSFMKAFECAKRDFTGIGDPTQEFEIPLYMAGIDDSEIYDKEERQVKLTSTDMLSFFEPVAEKVVGLLKSQIGAIKKLHSDRHIDTILLVGGFGDSRYLNQYIRNWCKGEGNTRLLCPKDPQAAIVKGAALRGLQGTRPSKRRCRRHYGFLLSMSFREGVDAECNSYRDAYTGEKMCRNRLSWEIHKGSEITEMTVIKTSLSRNQYRGSSLTGQLGVYCSSEEVPPERHDHKGAEFLGNIAYKFAETDRMMAPSKRSRGNFGEKIYRISFSCEIAMGSKEGLLRYTVKSDSGTIGRAEMEYA